MASWNGQAITDNMEGNYFALSENEATAKKLVFIDIC